jgi:hypothetical protein
MKSLPNVTLISYDNTDDPSRTLRALEFSSREIKFADVVLVCRKKPEHSNGTTIQRVGEKGYAAAMIWEIAGLQHYVETDFALCIHHDGYVINPNAWRDRWLQYDFIGAPWPASAHPCHPGKSEFPHGRVGNTGCCLKSKAFMRATAELRDLFIQSSKRPDRYGQQYSGDAFCCQHQRPALEQRGITFAPIEVAAAFAWESNIEEIPGDRPNAFGFHNFALENKEMIPRA